MQAPISQLKLYEKRVVAHKKLLEQSEARLKEINTFITNTLAIHPVVFNSLMETIKEVSYRDYLLCATIMAMSPMSIGKVLRLKISDIDKDNPLYTDLSLYTKGRTGYVFVTKNNKKIMREHLTRLLMSACCKLRIKRITPEVLRLAGFMLKRNKNGSSNDTRVACGSSNNLRAKVNPTIKDTN
jgi:integrase